MADITPKKALEKVAGWLEDESGFTIDESGTVVIDGDPPLELGLSVDDGRVVSPTSPPSREQVQDGPTP